MNHRSRITQRGKTETAGKADHRIIMNQPGWWFGLTPGLKDLLRKRLKECGYVGVERGTRKADRPTECQRQGAARARRGTWSEHAPMVTGKVSADSACPGGAGVDE